MTISTKTYDLSGNQMTWDGGTLAYDTITNLPIATALRPSIVCGTGTPVATLTAPKGTLYINLTGSSASTRMFVNDAGTNTWQAVTTAG